LDAIVSILPYNDREKHKTGMSDKIQEETAYMTKINLDEQIWLQFVELSNRLQIDNPEAFLGQWLRQIIKYEGIAEKRYAPIAAAIVTRRDAEVLLVGNEYAQGKPLSWNLPGGSVELGEPIREAVVRELNEETGLKAAKVSGLAWMVQSYQGADKTGVFAFAFEVTALTEQISISNEEAGGFVRLAEFVPFAKAYQRLPAYIATPLRDWLTLSRNQSPRIYWQDEQDIQMMG
jgi:ADP-ribose pyrophosphatase YjhB (NUDIX family)